MALVVPDNSWNCDVPVLVGTNVLMAKCQQQESGLDFLNQFDLSHLDESEKVQLLGVFIWVEEVVCITG